MPDHTVINEDSATVERTNMAGERTRLASDRTRLANKRTFLAWCRTALSFMTFGFLLEKIDVFLTSQHMAVSEVLLHDLGALGSFTFVIGPILVLFAGYRYYQLDRKLGDQSVGRMIFPEAIMLIAILCAAMIYLFV